MRAWLLVIAACAGPPKPAPEPIGNATSATATPQTEEKLWIRGTVIDAATREPLAGVTVVTSSQRDIDEERVMITNKKGTYSQWVTPGRYDVHFYYADMTMRRRNIDVANASVTVDLQIDQNRQSADILDCTSALASSCK